MIQIITPSSVHGYVSAPASKSVMQRACAAALLRKGLNIIHNYGKSNDDNAAKEAVHALGGGIGFYDDKTMFIEGKDLSIKETRFNCEESGLCLRMFTPIAAVFPYEIFIEAKGSLLNRPVDFFLDVLPELDVEIVSNQFPLRIIGPMQPKNITIDGSLSSQFISGLLFAYSGLQAKDKTITVTNLTSRPYIDLTLDVMKSFGLKVPVNNNYESFYFDNSEMVSDEKEFHYTVEGDWSGAAFILVAGAIAGSVTVSNLKQDSFQGDKKIIEVLEKAGAVIRYENENIIVSKNELSPFEFDATQCPDLFPPLVTLAANINGMSKIKGVHRLTHKESNRSASLISEFKKLNIDITVENDVMIVKGGTLKVIDENTSSHNDHRIAMALAVAALNADKKINISEADAVKKSYPKFWYDLSHLCNNSK